MPTPPHHATPVPSTTSRRTGRAGARRRRRWLGADATNTARERRRARNWLRARKTTSPENLWDLWLVLLPSDDLVTWLCWTLETIRLSSQSSASDPSSSRSPRRLVMESLEVSRPRRQSLRSLLEKSL